MIKIVLDTKELNRHTDKYLRSVYNRNKLGNPVHEPLPTQLNSERLFILDLIKLFSRSVVAFAKAS